MDELVQDYGWTSAEAPHSLAYLAPPVIQALRALGAQRVVDVGCGNGAMCGELRAAGFTVVGLDNDPRGVEIARRSHPGVTFHHCGVQSDPAAVLAQEGPFDAVVSTEVIEHLFSPHQLPLFAAGLLKPGGALLVTTPYHGYLKNLALSLAGKWDHHHTALWHGGHIKFWSRDTLGRLLADNGFRVERFVGIGRLPWLWKSMLLVGRRV